MITDAELSQGKGGMETEGVLEQTCGVFRFLYRKAKTMKLLIEIRAAEGGADAKLLVREQFAIYVNAARLHRL